MKALLRYPQDRWPLAYTLMVLAVQLGLFLEDGEGRLVAGFVGVRDPASGMKLR